MDGEDQDIFAPLRELEKAGGRFVKLEASSKKPVEAKWQEKPYSADEVVVHLVRGGNVGLLTGKPSGGLCVLDLDFDFPLFLERFPRFAATPRVTRFDAPERGKLLIRITGEVPLPRKWKPAPQEPPRAELLSSGNQAVMPPSYHPDGMIFEAHAFDAPIPELTVAEFDALWDAWTASADAVPAGAAPQRVAPRAGGKAAPEGRLFESARALRDAIAAEFDMVAYACHVLGASARQEGKEWRILGQGGLLIDPARGCWNTFGEEGTGKVGGDCFDLVSWLNFGIVRPSGQTWQEVLNIAATYLGFSLASAEYPRRKGVVLTGMEAIRHAGTARLVWNAWMLAGVPTLIGGAYSVGKSPLLLWIVAGYLRETWPDGTPVPEWFAGGNVLYCLPEGNASQLANLATWGITEPLIDRFHALGFKNGPDEKVDYEFSLDAEGLALLRSACAELEPRLIVVDGLRAAMEGDESRSQDSKAFWAPLTRLAHQYDAALIVTHHLRKGSEFLVRSGELPSMDWLRGSGDLVRPCRSVWIVDQPDVNDLAARRITLVKASEGARQITMAYRMAAPADGLEWGGDVPLPPPATKREAAERLLLNALQGGPQSYEQLLEMAQAEGTNEHTLRAARDVLSRGGKIEQVTNGKHLRFWRLTGSEE